MRKQGIAQDIRKQSALCSCSRVGAISAGLLAFMALPPVEDPRPIWAYAAMLVGMPLLFEHEQGRRKQQETPQAIEPRLEGEKPEGADAGGKRWTR